MDQATNVRRSSGSKPSLQLATGGFQWEATPGVVARQPESSSESEEEDESTEVGGRGLHQLMTISMFQL